MGDMISVITSCARSGETKARHDKTAEQRMVFTLALTVIGKGKEFVIWLALTLTNRVMIVGFHLGVCPPTSWPGSIVARAHVPWRISRITQSVLLNHTARFAARGESR